MELRPKDVFVAVQTCPERRQHRLRTLQSIENSDIGTRYSLLEHPLPAEPGPALPTSLRLLQQRAIRRRPRLYKSRRIMEHLRHVLHVMYDSGAPYSLRLEDDVLVNRNILHNLATWPALGEESFGVGWLFCSEALLKARRSVGYGRASKTPYRNSREMFASLGILFPRAVIPQVLGKLTGYSQDLAISRAVWDCGRRCFFHVPALVENRIRVPSARGNVADPRYHTTCGFFDKDFRR